MKHFLFSSIFLLIFGFGYAQKQSPDYSNIITTKKIVVKHSTDQPSEYLIPVVSKKYPKLRNALCDTTLFYGEKLDSAVKRYQTTGTGIVSLSYEITFANKDIISLKLYYETMGAHPDEYQRGMTLNIHSGKIYALSSEINRNGLKWIYTTYKTSLRESILEDKKDSECSDYYDYLRIAVDSLKINDLFEQYIFTKEGVAVSMEQILPHGAQVCEPGREWLIPYYKLKPYILPSAIVLNKWKRKTS